MDAGLLLTQYSLRATLHGTLGEPFLQDVRQDSIAVIALQEWMEQAR